MDSILQSIKKKIGFDSTYTAFDTDIIISINSCFAVLNQLGVGPSTPFVITGATETWSDFLGTATGLEMIKDYVYLKTRHTFDPPASSSVMQAIDNDIKELEWRISIMAKEG